jgi:anti-sigma factor RsiW
MSCVEFRRQLMIDPSCRDTAFLQHRTRCERCRKEVEQVDEMEKQLRELLAVPPPRTPRARLLAEQRASRTRRAWRARNKATAACLVLLAGWTGMLIHERIGADTLDQIVVEHIDRERAHLEERDAVAFTELVQLAGELGGDLIGDMGQVRWAGKCPVGGKLALHLVLEGEKGPVTVLVMPGRHLHDTLVVDLRQYHGVVMPTAFGSFAVVGPDGEPFDAIVANIRRGLVWNT